VKNHLSSHQNQKKRKKKKKRRKKRKKKVIRLLSKWLSLKHQLENQVFSNRVLLRHLRGVNSNISRRRNHRNRQHHRKCRVQEKNHLKTILKQLTLGKHKKLRIKLRTDCLI
jgi:hypothetical protein